MKLTDLNNNDIACIKKIKGSDDLVIHLMEMGLVMNTKIKVIGIYKDVINISFRDVSMLITKDIGRNIEVYDSSCR